MNMIEKMEIYMRKKVINMQKKVEKEFYLIRKYNTANLNKQYLKMLYYKILIIVNGFK